MASSDENLKNKEKVQNLSSNSSLVVVVENNNLEDEAHHQENQELEIIEPSSAERPTTSRQCINEEINRISIPDADAELRNYGGLINSTTRMVHHESYVKNLTCSNKQKNSVIRIPPSYSAVLKFSAPISPFNNHNSRVNYPSIPFLTRQPPPSYAEVHGGGWDEITNRSLSVDSFSLGPNPLYISCPRCRTIVVSDIHAERSHLSYIISLVLCVCLCWPCCLLPLCLKSCKNTYHFCPTCHYYLGVYKPC